MKPAEGSKTYHSKLSGVLCTIIGVSALACGVTVPFAAANPLLALVLVGIPACCLEALPC